MARRDRIFLALGGLLILALILAGLLMPHEPAQRHVAQASIPAQPTAHPPKVRPAQSAPAVSPAPLRPTTQEPAPTSAPTYWLRGLVITPNQQPVPRFSIQLYTMGFDPLTSADTVQTFDAPSGEFELSWPQAGPFDIMATAPGFVEGFLPQVLLVDAREEAPRYAIVLVPGAILRGRVVDQQDQPVAGARVDLGIYIQEISAYGGSGDPAEQQAAFNAYREEANLNPRQVTDAQGRFELTGVSQGAYPLTASHPGYYPAMQVMMIEPGSLAENIKLVLSKEGGSISVHVVDGQGSAIVGRAVTLETTPYKGATDSQGLWHAGDLAPGTYRVQVAPDPQIPQRNQPSGRWVDVNVTPGKESQVTIRLSAGTLVTGEVTRAGQAVVGAGIIAGQSRIPDAKAEDPQTVSYSYASASTQTDASGRFELPGLSAGDYQLTVAHGEESYAKINLTFSADEQARSIQIRLGAGRIEGVVRDAKTKEPISEALINFSPLNLEGEGRPEAAVFAAAMEREVATDSTGHYVVEGLADGTYALSANAHTYGMILAKTIEVQGPLVHHDFALWPAAQLILTVTNPQHIPLYHLPVALTPTDARDSLLNTVTNYAGQVQLSSLAPGSYEVVVGSTEAGLPLAREIVELASGDIKRLEMTVTEVSLPGAAK